MNRVGLFFILFTGIISFDVVAEENIHIVLFTNKQVVKNNEKFTITYRMVNNSNTEYSFSTLENQVNNSLIFYSEKGRIKRVSEAIFEIKLKPEESDIYILKPGDYRDFKFDFIYLKGRKTIRGKTFYNYLYNKSWDMYYVIDCNEKIFISGIYSLLSEEFLLIEMITKVPPYKKKVYAEKPLTISFDLDK